MPLTKIKSLGITDGTITGDDINSTFNLTGKTVTLPAGTGGKVLQVVSTANGTGFSTTSADYQNAISASITPSSASNKILIMGHTGALDSDTAANFIAVTLFRDATDLASASYFTVTRFESANASGNMAINHLDSPNTTSSITYTLKFKKSSGGGTVYFNNSGSNRIILMEIAG